MMLGYLVLAVFALIVLALALLVGLFSPLAMPLYHHLIERFVPELEIEQMQGSLFSGIRVNDLEWQNADWHLSVKHLFVALDWHCVRELQVCIDQVTIESPQLTQKTPSPPAPRPWQYVPPTLPRIAVPVPLRLATFDLTHFVLIQQEQSQQIDALHWNDLSLIDSHVSWRQLMVEHPVGRVEVTGEIYLERTYPLDISLDATGTGPAASDVKIQLGLTGALDELDMQLSVSGMANANMRASINLLDAALPLEGEIHWPAQTLPLQQQTDMMLGQGAMTVQGNLDDIHINGQTAFSWAEHEAMSLAFGLTTNTHRAILHELALTSSSSEGTVVVMGEWFLGDGGSGNLDVRLNALDLSHYNDALPRQLSGDLGLKARHTAQGWEVLSPTLHLSGVHSEHAFVVDGHLAYSQANRLLVTQLTATQQQNRIEATIKLLQDRYLDAAVLARLPMLSFLHPDLSGEIEMQGNIQGPWQTPELDIEAVVNTHLPPLDSPLIGKARLKGTALTHVLDLNIQTAPHQWQLALQGVWQEDVWTAEITKSSGRLAMTQWQLQHPFSVSVENLAAPVVTVSPHCWLADAEGKLCLEQFISKADNISWQVNATQLPVVTWLRDYLPNTLTLQQAGRISGSISQTAGTWQQPQIVFDASLNRSELIWTGDKPIPLTLSELSLSGHYQQHLSASLRLVSAEFGSVQASAVLDLDTQRLIESEMTLSAISLAPLSPWSSRIASLNGVISGALSAHGAITMPIVSGALTLSDGALDIEGMPIAIADWQQTLNFMGDRVSMNGDFLIGEGPGKLSGELTWGRPWQLDLALSGDAFLVELPQISLQVSPVMKMQANETKVVLNGNVEVPWARVKIDRLPENAIEPSKDVHLRGEPPPQDPLAIVDARITLLVDPKKTGEVRLDAFGLTAHLHGQLEVATQPAMVGYGDLQLGNGRYQAYGQDLVIKTGELQFNGPLSQPFLLLEAIRDPTKTDDNVIAGIRISGPADQPNVSLFSEPAMDQSASLAYLLTGSGPGAKSESPNYNALLLGFGLSKTEAFTNQMGKTLGIRDLSIGTTAGSGGSNTRLAVSGRLNDRLSLQYNVDVGLGANDDTSQNIRRRQEPPDLALRYRLLPQLFIEAIQTSIQEQTDFAVDLYYEFLHRPDKAPIRDQE